VHRWIQLEAQLGGGAANEAFKKNMAKAMLPASVAAYLLNPKYRGN
jgi:hypothetical protein